MIRSTLAAALLLAPFAAKADWQYTKWDMTPEEVISASNGEAKPLDEKLQVGMRSQPGLTPMAIGKHATECCAFDVQFHFGADRKLGAVMLVLADRTKVDLLRRDLMEAYGAPVDRNAGGGSGEITWRDAAAGHVVRLVWFSSYAHLAYRPLPKGL